MKFPTIKTCLVALITILGIADMVRFFVTYIEPDTTAKDFADYEIELPDKLNFLITSLGAELFVVGAYRLMSAYFVLTGTRTIALISSWVTGGVCLVQGALIGGAYGRWTDSESFTGWWGMMVWFFTTGTLICVLTSLITFRIANASQDFPTRV